MSFSEISKNDVIKYNFKNNCCKNAFCAGLLADASLLPSGQTELTVSEDSLVPFISESLEKRFRRELTKERSTYLGRVLCRLHFQSASAGALLKSFSAENDLERIVQCEQCKHAFIAGMYLACGHMADPSRSYHLYFSFHNAERAAVFDDFISSVTVKPKTVTRKNTVELYYKSINDISDVLTLIGCGKSVFDVLNSQIEREIRNQENRATNCVTKNIAASVKSAGKQILLFQKMKESGLLASLPDDLRQTAELRLSFPDVSMQELAEYHKPPISKSGVFHRIQRIEEIYRKTTE